MSTELLFCKSKVFIHPSRDHKENIPGFLIITKDFQQLSQQATLSWIPEYSLSKDQFSDLEYAENFFVTNLNSKSLEFKKDIVLQIMYITWAFSIKLDLIYSIQFRVPSPNGWWFGSIIIHLRSNENMNGIPILFFHDNVCPSTKIKQTQLSKSFDPFVHGNDIYWGGDDFKAIMSLLIDLQPTVVEKSIYLVNATLDDLRNFSSTLTMTSSSGTSNLSNVWKSLENTKWTLMSKIADVTTKTTHIVTNLIKIHPLSKLIEKNMDNPYMEQLLNNPNVQLVQDDFDSAKIYLAKWALGVKEQAEKYQSDRLKDGTYIKLITHELCNGSDITFTHEEINIVSERSHRLTKNKWDSFFDSKGRLSISINEVKDYIFHGGIESLDLRKEVWCFLLGVFPWDSSREERRVIEETLRESYQVNYKSRWQCNSFIQGEDKSYRDDQIYRIEKDVKRNDRNLDLYKYNTIDGLNVENSTSESLENFNVDDICIKNPHLLALRNILISYNIYNDNLGYVQGMTDLLSPIYYVLRDEAISFWCFVKFMNRMERNFLRDQSGIRDQMLVLTQLCQLMLPQFSEHLNKCDSLDLFFSFRMLLVWFKREFSFNEICTIWEIFWTDYYSSQYCLFFMLAILQNNSVPVMHHLTEFDQILKYFNDLRHTMNLNDLMVRSELLFMKFKRILETIERNEDLCVSSSSEVTSSASIKTTPQKYLPTQYISADLKQLLSKNIIIKQENPRKKISTDKLN